MALTNKLLRFKVCIGDEIDIVINFSSNTEEDHVTTQHKPGSRKARLEEAQAAWEKTKHGSRAEKSAFQAWLKLCRTGAEFNDIYHATKSSCSCKLAVVYRLVQIIKTLSRIVRLCEKISASSASPKPAC